MTAAPVTARTITTALIERAADDLSWLQGHTGLSETDIVNRAVTLYRFAEEQIAAGKALVVQDPDDGTVLTVQLL